MLAYLISYDIVSPDTNRGDVERDIESIGVAKKFLTTTYLVSTFQSIEDVQTSATKSLKRGDKMVICEKKRPVKGHLYKDEWAWINQNL